MLDSGVKSKVIVEFYGPFREYGKSHELRIDKAVTFEELIELLEKSLGVSFRERAMKENSTYILNSKIINRKKIDDVLIHPGDKVAFALLIGGG